MSTGKASVMQCSFDSVKPGMFFLTVVAVFVSLGLLQYSLGMFLWHHGDTLQVSLNFSADGRD